MVCPVCGQRKARRACPALGRQICPVCCGTKRLTEIQCPADCPYLVSSREHPPAVAVRQQQRDLALMVHAARDLSERQSQLLLLTSTLLVGHASPGLQPLCDEDVLDAMEALAATYETSARGVIYEHRPESASAAQLVAALKPVLAEAARGAAGSFDRDAAVALRRLQEAGRQAHDAANRRAFVELLGRVIHPKAPERTAEAEHPRLIVP
jgi:hypothetical protein